MIFCTCCGVVPNVSVDINKFSSYAFDARHGKDVIYKNLGYTVNDSARLQEIYRRQATSNYMRGNYTLGNRDIYEDNVLGRVTDEQFRILSATYTEEQADLGVRLPKIEAEIERLEVCVTNVDRFIERARRYTQITELTPEILRMFISKIVVHEKSEKYSRTAEQKVEIHYTHIGAMENTDDSVKTEMERTA